MNENEAITVTLTLENDEELDRAAAGAVHDGCPGRCFRLLRRCLLHGHVRNGRDTDHGGNLPLHDGRQGRGRLRLHEGHVR